MMKQWHIDWRRAARTAYLIVLFLGLMGCSMAKERTLVVADAETGVITAETARYMARFEGGTLVYLHNKLRNQVMVDAGLNAERSGGLQTALYVADQPKTEPYWICPATEGEGRSTVTVAEPGGDGVSVTFKGLVALPKGKDQRRFPEAELTVHVSVEAKTGHLLVKTTGRSPETLVIGSAFAYKGLIPHSINYTTAASGLKTDVDLENGRGRGSVLEWANINMGKRLGLKGGLWPAAVTVQASADDPAASFSVWAEDDVPRSKYLIEQGAGNAYATYEMPPYDDNHKAASVEWRVNVFDGGWTAAAAPFADSLKQRSYVDGRASWREDISLIIFTNGIGKSFFESMAAAFPPEVRGRILIWMPQAWRTLTNTQDPKTEDAYYWDNNFSEETAAAVRYATEAGFRVSGYTNPHFHWGDSNKVIDPEIRKIVKGFSVLPIIGPVSQEKIGHTGHSLAFTPYREHMLRTYKHIYDNLDMSVYMDTMHQIPLDGRGTAINGMSNYEGTLKFFRDARALKREQFIGMEFLTELGVMGLCGDYGLIQDLVWSQGWEKYKASHSHPILSYLYRDTSLQVSQRVAPWSYGGPRYYHLAEEMTERIGTIATTEWPFQNTSPEDKLDTPEKQQWFAKIQLYVRRGLRPYFPDDWEDGVMSYLKAKDGTVFKYLETDFGSQFVEFPKGGGLFKRSQPVLHYARAWKTPVVKAGNGFIHDWIGVADNGDFIGLDNEARGYCLFPEADTSADHLRFNALPESLVIIASKVEPDLAVIELGPRDRKQEKPAIWGNVEGTAGKPVEPITGTIGLVTDQPLVRIAAAHPPAPTLKALGQADGHYRYELSGEFWGDVAFIWREGVHAPFEPTNDYLLPVTVAPPAEPGEYFVALQPFDQRWNAEIGGPRNPRPGTVYQASGTALKTGDTPGNLAFFLTNPSTKGSGLFSDTFGAKVEGNEPMSVAFAGVRQPKMDVVGVRHLALRSFPVGAPNVRLTQLGPIRFIRPTLTIDRIDPIDLGTVGNGAGATSPPRTVCNSQQVTVTAAGKIFSTLLYGAARVRVPDAKRPDLQETDHTGIVLTGRDAKLYRLKGEHPGPDGGLMLVGTDDQLGLLGGEQPETESFAVEFIGAAEPGEYTATVRIVTQAGNLGVCSTGQDGEPLAGIYYVDIPVSVTVE
jgi:hypothetical protein